VTRGDILGTSMDICLEEDDDQSGVCGGGGDWSKFQGGRGKEGPDSVHILLLGRKKVIISNGLDIENSRNILMQRVETKWGWGMGGKHVIEQDADMHMVVATISTSLQSQIKT
jgi:hypothetical protein